MNKNDRLDLTDLVYFPATFLLSYVLSRWLPGAVAAALAVLVILTLLYLIGRAIGSTKNGFVIPVVAAGAVTLILALIGWPQ